MVFRDNMGRQTVIQSVFVIWLIVATENRANAQSKEHGEIPVKEKIWSLLQPLLQCSFDVSSINAGHFISSIQEEFIEAVDNIRVTQCALEVGNAVFTTFSEPNEFCANSKYVLVAEAFLTCTGMTEKFFHVLESQFRKSQIETIHQDGTEEKYTGHIHKPSNKLEDDEEMKAGDNWDTDDHIDDNTEDRPMEFLRDQKKVRMGEAQGHPVEQWYELENSDSDQEKKKKEKPSGCTLFDVLEGAGRGFLGGGAGGSLGGGGKLGAAVGAGVGTVVGGIAGCKYGGYDGGVIGGTAGGAAGGFVGTWKGLVAGGIVGANVAGMKWGEITEKIGRTVNGFI